MKLAFVRTRHVLVAALMAGAPALAGTDGTPATDSGAEGSAPPEDYEFGLLFDAPGVEETYYTCSACHSERIVAQQGLSRKGWEELLEWMVEEQGMPEIEPFDRERILEYLSEHYNVDRPNFPSHMGN